MVQISGTIAFFKAMAPVLIANVLTVTFVYCFAKISRKELKGEDEGRLTYLWLIILVFLFMLYGLHTWGVSAASNCCSSGGWEKAAQVRPMRCIRAFEAIDRPGHSNVSLPLKSGSSNQTQLGPVMTLSGLLMLDQKPTWATMNSRDQARPSAQVPARAVHFNFADEEQIPWLFSRLRSIRLNYRTNSCFGPLAPSG